MHSRLPYNQTDAYRFYNGPIDNEDDGPEAAMNGWPLDENYVDYTRDVPTAGIINDATKYPDLTGDMLAHAERGRRGEEHRHGLPRDRIPAVGPG